MVVGCEIKESHLGQKEKHGGVVQAVLMDRPSPNGFHRRAGTLLLVE